MRYEGGRVAGNKKNYDCSFPGFPNTVCFLTLVKKKSHPRLSVGFLNFIQQEIVILKEKK